MFSEHAERLVIVDGGGPPPCGELNVAASPLLVRQISRVQCDAKHSVQAFATNVVVLEMPFISLGHSLTLVALMRWRPVLAPQNWTKCLAR